MATMLGQPGQQKEVVFDLDAAAFSGDEFRMYQFKVKRCPRARPHDWTQCPFAHPGEKAKRRDPRRYRYSGTACPEFRRNGCCRRGDACPFAHGVFECWLHPSRYRTQMCTDGSSCKRRVCFFAHTDNELRKPEEDPVWLQQQYQAELAAEQQVQQQIQALKVFTNLLSGSNQTAPQSEALKNIPASQLGSLFPGLGTTQTVGSPPNLGSSSVSAPAGALEEKVKSLGGEAAVMQLLDMLEKSGAAAQSQPVPAPVTSVGSAPQQSLATLLSSLAGGTGEHGLDSQALQAIKAAVPEKTQQQQMMDFLASMLPAVGQQQSGAAASEAQSSSAAAQVPPALGNMQDLLRSLGVDLPMNSSPPAPTPPPLTPMHSITSAGAGAGGSNSGAAPSGSANTTTASAADFAAMLSAALGGGKAPVVPPAAPPPPAAAAAAPPRQTESLPTPFGVFTNNAAASEAVASAPAATPAAAAAGPGGAVDMATVMAVLQQTGLLSLLPGAAVAQLQQQQQAAAAAPAVAAPAAPCAAGPSGPEAPKSVDPLQAALASLGLGGTAGSGPVAAERSASPEQQQQTAAAAAAAVAAEPSGSLVASSPERPSSDGGASSTGAASSTSPAAVTPSNNTSAGGGPELQAEASSASSVPATGSETSMDAAEAVAGGSGAPAPIGSLALPAELQGSEDGQALLSLFQSLTAKPEMLAHAQLLIDSLTRGAAGKAAAPAEPSA